MKAKEIREMSADEIRQRIREEKAQLDHLSFQHAIADVQNPIQMRTARRLIARLSTILTQKESTAAGTAA
ncbi:MAG: 50S ribosomal protein L29 [Rhodothermales bacterium]|nr:50S ribosomal protein L29 [Rhodothermales bacterium]